MVCDPRIVAVPASCDGIGSTRKDVSGRGHIVESGTACSASGAVVLVGVGNMVAVSACDGIRSTREVTCKDVSWSGSVAGSGTA